MSPKFPSENLSKAPITALFLVTVGIASAPAAPNAIFSRAMIATLQRSHVPVLLPSWLPKQNLVAQDLRLDDNGYSVRYDYGKRCGGIEVCKFGSLTVTRATAPRDPWNTRLADGTPAHFEPIHCGGSCAPASLTFDRGGFEYRLTDRIGKDTLLDTANALAPLPQRHS